MRIAKWGTYSFHAETTPDISKFFSNAELQNQNLARYDLPDSEHVRIRNSRISRAEPQLPLNIFPGTKTRRHPAPDIQFEAAEQIRSNETIPTLQSFSCSNLFATSRLDGQNGSEPSIFPHTYCPTASQIPKALLPSRSESQPTASDDVFTVRPCLSSENVCDRNQLDRRATEKPRYQMCSLLGRLSAGKPVYAQTARRYSLDCEYYATTGLGYKLRKVCSESDTMPRVSRHYLGHKTQRNVSVGVEVPIATQSTSRTAYIRQVVPKTISTPNGKTELCQFRDQKRSSSLPNSAILQSTAVKESPVPKSYHSAASSDRHKMVDKCDRCTHADTHECCNSSIDDRRFQYWLGRSDQRSFHYGYMEKDADVMARQQERNVCRVRSGSPRTKSPTRCADTATDRQPDSGFLYQQRRRHKIKEITQTNSTAALGFRHIKRASSCSILSRKIQRRSRRSITPEKVSRMASHSRSHINHFPNVGDARDGSVRVQDGSCDTEVRLDGRTRSPGTTSQRVLSPMALRARVVISTTEFDSASSQSPEPSQRQVHPYCPEMEQSVLASRCSTPRSETSLSDSRSSSKSNRHSNRCTPAGNSRSAFGSMADFGWQDMLTKWTNQEQDLLMSSWRPSTKNTYRPAWARWRRWCNSHSIDFKNPNAEQVARYLAYLHCDVGLAYKTILLHKSVISTFTHLNSSMDLSKNFFVKHMLKAISVARVKPVKPPIWNPKLLLQFLSSYKLDNTNLYQVSKHTATLLLLASGRRVHDLTLLRIDQNSLIDEDTSIVLWPAFGSKTDSVNHRQSGWRLREHPDNQLNVIFWIRELLKLSSYRRQNIDHLFITARGEAKPAPRTVIGGWVKSLLKDAGIEASPGSCRSAVASLNWLENFPLDKILATGNWRTVHTFRNYYKKEIRDYNAVRINSLSLSNYFDPVTE